MISAAIIVLIISAILLMATLHNWLGYLKPGVYPPKQVLKSRVLTLGCAGGILLLIGTVILYFI